MKLEYIVGLKPETKEEAESELYKTYQEIAKHATTPEYHELYAHLLLHAVRYEWENASYSRGVEERRNRLKNSKSKKTTDTPPVVGVGNGENA